MRGLVVVMLACVLGSPVQARARRAPDLCAALASGKVAAVERALRTAREVRGTRCQGQPALHHAILRGAGFEVILALLQAGVDVNQPGQGGDTPLILAARLRDVDLVKLLFQYGADPGRRNAIGLSAIDVAQETGRSALLTAMGIPVQEPVAVERAPAARPEDAGPAEDAAAPDVVDAGSGTAGPIDARAPDTAEPPPPPPPAVRVESAPPPPSVPPPAPTSPLPVAALDDEGLEPAPPAAPGLGRKILLFVGIAAGIAIGLRLLLRLLGRSTD